MARVDLARCPDCDKPIATDKDERTIPEGKDDHLCWRRWNLGGPDGFCMEPRVDWRGRALAAEAVVEAAERFYDSSGNLLEHRALIAAVAAYRKGKAST